MKRYLFIITALTLTLYSIQGIQGSQEFLIQAPFSQLKAIKESPVVPVAFFENSVVGRITEEQLTNLRFDYKILLSLPTGPDEHFFIVYPSPYLEKSEAKTILKKYGEILFEDGDAFFIKISKEKAYSLPPLGFEITFVSLIPVILPEESRREEKRFEEISGQENPVVRAIIDQITPTEVAQFVRELSGEVPVTVRGRLDTIRTRYTPSPKNSVALWYIYEKFQNFLLDSINFHSYSSDSNIIGIKNGRHYPPQFYWIIGGHMDCVSEQSNTYAPGADDNASGTVAAMIAAKYMSRYPFKYTIKFIGWNGEEQGLLGSAAHAQLARTRGDSIRGVLNGDMIATEMTDRDSVRVYTGTRAGSVAIGDTFFIVNQRYNIGLRVGRIPSAPANSDHYSYYSRGFEAIMAHEADFSPNYHSTRDRITAVEFDTLFYTKVIKAMVATLATLAQPIVSGVSYQRHSIVDSTPLGNGDGILNPGESCEMPTWVKNFSNSPAQGVRGILRHSRSDPNVTLSDSVKYFGTIPAGDSAFTGPNGFNITVASACTNGYILPLEFVATDTLESTWVSQLDIKVGTPILFPQGVIAWDSPPGGNGNGRIDPGEVASIAVGIKNSGIGNGYNVTAVLKSADFRFVILDSFGRYDTVIRDTIIFNTVDKFRVSANSSIPREFPIPCTLKIYSENYTFVRPFNIIVGKGTIVDPIPDGPRTPPRYWAYDEIDSFYVEAPTFRWIELRNRGQQLPITGDDQTIRIPLPFPFKYYGQRYVDSLSVCSNGWISPIRTTSTTNRNRTLPDATSDFPSAMICAVWDDLDPRYGNRIWYLYEPDSHRFIIEWDSVHYYNPQSQWDKFQIIVYDTTVTTYTGDNEIIFQYLTANNYGSITIGIEDETNQIGITALNNNSYDHRAAPMQPQRAIKFTTDTLEQMVGTEEGVILTHQPVRFIVNTIARGRVKMFVSSLSQDININIYNITGRKIKTVTKDYGVRNKKGGLEMIWSGDDENGRKVATGIYILRLEGKGLKAQEKIIFIR